MNKSKIIDLVFLGLIILLLIAIIPKTNKGKIKGENKENTAKIYSAENDSLFFDLFADTE
jgi:hypothetical protein